MSDKRDRLRESLSALMDNQADEMEVRRTLKAVESDTDLRATWHRYQLAAATMRRDLPAQMTDLSSRISAAIAEESAPNRGLARFLSPVGRVAIAASVAVFAVMGVQQMQVASTPSGQQAQRAMADSSGTNTEYTGPQFQLPSGFELPVNARTVSAGTQPVPDQRPVLIVNRALPDRATQQEIQLYLNDLMLRHTEQAALNNGQGMLPFARLPQQPRDEQ